MRIPRHALNNNQNQPKETDGLDMSDREVALPRRDIREGEWPVDHVRLRGELNGSAVLCERS